MSEFTIELSTVTTEKSGPDNDRKKRRTSDWMTKYEYSRLLAARTVQLSRGALSTIDATGMTDASEIAKQELHARVIPLIIRRVLPGGVIEVWNPRHMNIRDY